MTVPFTKTDNSLTVVLDFFPQTIPSSHPHWSKILEALANGANDNEIRALIDIPSAIADFMLGNITLENRVIRYKGLPVDNYLGRHILRFMAANDPKLAVPLIVFLDNVMLNPSYRAVQGLYEWVERSNLPITGDGHLLAWKIVRGDYLDYHSTSFDHRVGNIVEQDRNLCDEDPDETCSAGLHFCSYAYLPKYQNGDETRRIVIVKIHPRDVVAVPRDYGCSKGRCCRYEVVGEVAPDTVAAFFPTDERIYVGFDDDDDVY